MSVTGIGPNLTSPIGSNPSSRIGAKDVVKQTGETFDQLLGKLSQSQNDSDALLQKLSAGEDVDLHQLMIATEQTDVGFRVALAIRDKLVDAYKEISRMSV